MEELQSILTTDINSLAKSKEETINQCFINTATELLSRYEEIHGVQVDVEKSAEFRRERIRAKIRGTGTTTKQMIIDTASSFSNGEVEVIEDNENYRFIIKFVGTLGTPQNIKDLTLTIEEIKPAHLSFDFSFIYMTHGELKTYTHNQLSVCTHKQIREGEL